MKVHLDCFIHVTPNSAPHCTSFALLWLCWRVQSHWQGTPLMRQMIMPTRFLEKNLLRK